MKTTIKNKEHNMKIKNVFKASLITLLLGVNVNSYAASDDECAIWLCAPFGFPPGCEAARDAMHHRVKHRKSPIPAWSSCSNNNNNNDGMQEQDGVAAYLPERTVKTEKCLEYRPGVDSYGRSICKKYEYKTLPETYIKGTPCNRYCGSTGCHSSPEGCTATFHYVEIFQNGQQIGETYYFTY